MNWRNREKYWGHFTASVITWHLLSGFIFTSVRTKMEYFNHRVAGTAKPSLCRYDRNQNHWRGLVEKSLLSMSNPVVMLSLFFMKTVHISSIFYPNPSADISVELRHTILLMSTHSYFISIEVCFFFRNCPVSDSLNATILTSSRQNQSLFNPLLIIFISYRVPFHSFFIHITSFFHSYHTSLCIQFSNVIFYNECLLSFALLISEEKTERDIVLNICHNILFLNC